MPLVFVHGVNTRKSAEYEAAELARNALFRKYCLAAIAANPDAVLPFNPYWGDQAAKFPYNVGFAHDTQPGLQSFGAGSDVLDQALHSAGVSPTPAKRNDVIVSVAKRDFAEAVDLLWAAAGTSGRMTESAATDLAETSIAVEGYVSAQGSTSPGWVAAVTSDGQFAEKLLDEVEAWAKAGNVAGGGDAAAVESFGIRDVLDRLKRSAASASDRAADAMFGQFVQGKLPDIVRRFSCFFGDVFEYLKQRYSGTTKIADIVLADLRSAARVAKDKRDPMVCIGHSMGGGILYDLLTDSSIADVPDCDLFVTVGSQVGLFEELKLFQSSDPNFPPNPNTRVPRSRHPRIKRWINVFDRADPFGYPASTIFEGATDFVFDTKASSLSAHGAYFLQPTFHARLRARVAQR